MEKKDQLNPLITTLPNLHDVLHGGMKMLMMPFCNMANQQKFVKSYVHLKKLPEI